jgi:hypothetical protein
MDKLRTCGGAGLVGPGNCSNAYPSIGYAGEERISDVFVVSDRSSYMTESVVNVDGGYTALHSSQVGHLEKHVIKAEIAPLVTTWVVLSCIQYHNSLSLELPSGKWTVIG